MLRRELTEGAKMSVYQIDYVALNSKWAVRVVGSTVYISEHDTKHDALAAKKRYELGDKRRQQQQLDVNELAKTMEAVGIPTIIFD
jgi:hypothetical protein